jgi:hypothetical protein
MHKETDNAFGERPAARVAGRHRGTTEAPFEDFSVGDF